MATKQGFYSRVHLFDDLSVYCVNVPSGIGVARYF